MTTQENTQPGGEILLHQTEDGRPRIGVRHSRESGNPESIAP